VREMQQSAPEFRPFGPIFRPERQFPWPLRKPVFPGAPEWSIFGRYPALLQGSAAVTPPHSRLGLCAHFATSGDIWPFVL